MGRVIMSSLLFGDAHGHSLRRQSGAPQRFRWFDRRARVRHPRRQGPDRAAPRPPVAGRTSDGRWQPAAAHRHSHRKHDRDAHARHARQRRRHVGADQAGRGGVGSGRGGSARVHQHADGLSPRRSTPNTTASSSTSGSSRASRADRSRRWCSPGRTQSPPGAPRSGPPTRHERGCTHQLPCAPDTASPTHATASTALVRCCARLGLLARRLRSQCVGAAKGKR